MTKKEVARFKSQKIGIWLWNAVFWAWYSQCNTDLTAVNIVCNGPANEWASQESFTNWGAVQVFLSITDELLATEWFWGQGQELSSVLYPQWAHQAPVYFYLLFHCIFLFMQLWFWFTEVLKKILQWNEWFEYFFLHLILGFTPD